MNKKLNVNIDEGEVFFAHEVSANYGPTQFVFDFKSLTPRMDMRSKESAVLALKHNVVLLNPWTAKEVSNMLLKVITKYEKDFGEIIKPEALKKYERKTKGKKTKKKDTEAITYFG